MQQMTILDDDYSFVIFNFLSAIVIVLCSIFNGADLFSIMACDLCGSQGASHNLFCRICQSLQPQTFRLDGLW